MTSPVFVEIKGSVGDLKTKIGEAKRELTGLSKHGASEMDKLAAVGKGAVLGLGAALVTMGALGVKAAAEQESATAVLRQAVVNTGKSWSDYSGQIDKAEGSARKLGFTNDETAQAMARLTQASHNPAKAIKDLALAEDIARGRHIDLAEATNILAKVETGHVALLGRLGINTKDATGATISQTEAVNRLGQMFGGSASAYAQTFAGKIAALKAQAVDLEATIGNALIPVVLRVGRGALAVAGFFERNKAAAITLGGAVAGVLVPAMGAYALAQGRAVSATTIGLLDELAGGFLTLGSTLIGVSEDAVLASGSMSALVATTAAGAVPFVAAAAAIGALTIAQQHEEAAADKMADQFLKTHTTIQEQVDGLNQLSAASTKGSIPIRTLAEHTGLLGYAVSGLLPPLISLSGEHRKMNDEVGKIKDKINAADKANRDYAASLDKAAQEEGFADAATQKLSETVDKMAGSLTGLLSATESEKNANDAVTTAEQRLADARAKVNQLTKEGSVDAALVAEATKAHQRAVDSAASAINRQRDAQKALNDILHPSARTQSEAQIAATKAADEVTRAQLRVKESEAKLAAVRKDGSSTTSDIIAAEIDLRDAQESVTEAEYAQQDAEQKVTDLMPGNIQLTDTYKNAKQQLDDATKGVADANDAERDAAAKLRTAQAGDPSKIADLANAKRDEKTAQNELTTAKQNASKAAFDHAKALQAELDSLNTSSGATDALIANLNALSALDPAAAPYVQQLVALFGSASTQNASRVVVDKNGNFHAPGVRGFAAGGRPPVGRDVLVGEDGPEVARFDAPATIYPHGSSPSGGNAVIYVTVNEARTPEMTAAAVAEKLAENDARNRR